MRAIWHKTPYTSIDNITLKIVYLNFQLNLPGVKELNISLWRVKCLCYHWSTECLLAYWKLSQHWLSTGKTSFLFITVTLHEHHAISNHWQFNCFINGLFRLTAKKIFAPHYWPFVSGIHLDWWILLRKSSNTERVLMAWCLHDFDVTFQEHFHEIFSSDVITISLQWNMSLYHQLWYILSVLWKETLLTKF